jgi:LPS export ABC transporter protein LptC
MKKFVEVIVLLIFLQACQEAPKVEFHEPYKGPLGVLKNIHTVYTDQAVELIEVKAKEQIEFQTGDREFPKGIEIIFFENDKPSSKMTANKAYYSKATNMYRGVGNVVVQSLNNDDKLESEELNWNPRTKKVTTDKFVRIENKDEILTGDGLEADQDFKKYKFKNPKGIINKKYANFGNPK